MDNWSSLLVSLRAEEFLLIPDGERSTYTRLGAPPSYDKHLFFNLTPTHTEILNSLAGSLVDKVDVKIKLMQDTHKDQPPDRLVFTERPIPMEVMAKTGVSQWYLTRAYTWCQIAAALQLHNGNWDWSMLLYTMDIMPQYALADGAIVVLSDASFNHLAQELHLSINDEMRAVWKVLRERTVQNTIISWEFKSLFADSEEVMQSIVRVIRLGVFQWEVYEEDKCKKHSPHAGCDASNPLAGPPSNDLPDDDNESGPNRKRQRLIAEEEEEEEEEETAAADDSHRSNYQDTPEKKHKISFNVYRAFSLCSKKWGLTFPLGLGPGLYQRSNILRHSLGELRIDLYPPPWIAYPVLF